MVTVANNSETAKAVVHHTIKRLSAGERKNTLVTDLYSLFPAANQMNSQETNPQTMHSAKTVNQDSITAPMSIPAITSRKEINAASLYREVAASKGSARRGSMASPTQRDLQQGSISMGRSMATEMHRNKASAKKKTPGLYATTGGFQLLCQPGVGTGHGGMPGWLGAGRGGLAEELPRDTSPQGSTSGAGGLVGATCHGIGKFRV
jgi:hypothetical protein